ncbi:MAG: hypothetical protein ABJE63_12800 [Lentilitoribacter sp.]
MGLEFEFDHAMQNIYHTAKRELNYNASIFWNMLAEHRGVLTAKKLINSDKPSEGYTYLWEKQRLDLTVEALVVENAKWHSLFEQSEIIKAKQRLSDYEYRLV